MSCTRYRSLRRLEIQRPYKIVRSAECANKKILFLIKGYGDEEEFMSLLLLPEHLLQAFRDAKRLNIEKTARMPN